MGMADDLYRIRAEEKITKAVKDILSQEQSSVAGESSTRLKLALWSNGIIARDFHVLKLRAILKNNDAFELDENKMWRLK